MATHKRRLLHKSCRRPNRGGIGPRGSNNPRQVQVAKLKYERWGMLVGQPQGHKGFGYLSAFPEQRWQPLSENCKEGTPYGGIPLAVQKQFLKDHATRR